MYWCMIGDEDIKCRDCVKVMVLLDVDGVMVTTD